MATFSGNRVLYSENNLLQIKKNYICNQYTHIHVFSRIFWKSLNQSNTLKMGNGDSLHSWQLVSWGNRWETSHLCSWHTYSVWLLFFAAYLWNVAASLFKIYSSASQNGIFKCISIPLHSWDKRDHLPQLVSVRCRYSRWLQAGWGCWAWGCSILPSWQLGSGHPGRPSLKKGDALGDPAKSQWLEGGTWTSGSASLRWQVELGKNCLQIIIATLALNVVNVQTFEIM